MILYLFFNVTSDLKLNSELSTARVHIVKHPTKLDTPSLGAWPSEYHSSSRMLFVRLPLGTRCSPPFAAIRPPVSVARELAADHDV